MPYYNRARSSVYSTPPTRAVARRPPSPASVCFGFTANGAGCTGELTSPGFCTAHQEQGMWLNPTAVRIPAAERRAHAESRRCCGLTKKYALCCNLPGGTFKFCWRHGGQYVMGLGAGPAGEAPQRATVRERMRELERLERESQADARAERERWAREQQRQREEAGRRREREEAERRREREEAERRREREETERRREREEAERRREREEAERQREREEAERRREREEEARRWEREREQERARRAPPPPPPQGESYQRSYQRQRRQETRDADDEARQSTEQQRQQEQANESARRAQEQLRQEAERRAREAQDLQRRTKILQNYEDECNVFDALTSLNNPNGFSARNPNSFERIPWPVSPRPDGPVRIGDVTPGNIRIFFNDARKIPNFKTERQITLILKYNARRFHPDRFNENRPVLSSIRDTATLNAVVETADIVIKTVNSLLGS